MDKKFACAPAGVTRCSFVSAASLSWVAMLAPSVDAQSPDYHVEPTGSAEYARPAAGRTPASPGPARVYGGMHFGGSGGLHATYADELEANSGDADLGFLIGLQGGVDLLVHEYVALGGELRFTSSQIDDPLPEDDRFLFLDLAFRPRGRYWLSKLGLEIYGATPLGLSVVAPRNGFDTKVHLNMGVATGAMYFFNDHMGVNGELAGVFHWYRDEEDVYGTTLKMRFGQFYLFSSFVYAL